MQIKFSSHIVILLVAMFGLSMAVQPMSSVDSVRWLIQQSRYNAVAGITQRLQQTHLATAEIYYLDGLAKKNLYQFAPAILSFARSYEMDSSLTENLPELGNCYKSLNNFNQALTCYGKACAKDPSASSLQSELANAYMVVENYDRALILYRHLYNTDSQNVCFLRNMARCYDYIGRDDSAMICYQKCLQPINGDFQTVYRLCTIWMKYKMYDAALTLTNEYQRQDSANARINSLNAYLCMMKHDYAESNRLFQKCYQNHDESKFTLKYLGITAFKLNDMEGAKTYLEKAYRADSTDYEVTNFLGIACATSAYKRLGIYYLNKTLRLITPDSVYLGNIYGNLGKAYDAYSNAPCEKALYSYLQARNFNPSDSLILYLIATKYDFCLKDKEQAMKYYSQFLSLFPPDKKGKGADINVVSYYSAALRRLKELSRK